MRSDKVVSLGRVFIRGAVLLMRNELYEPPWRCTIFLMWRETEFDATAVISDEHESWSLSLVE